MDLELLRQWKVLRVLRDSELKNIAYVVIYGDELNAIFIEKGTHNVYSLCPNPPSVCVLPFSMEGLPTKSKSLLSQFSGLDLEKIVVGHSVVGGLDRSGRAHMWHRFTPTQKECLSEDEAVIMFKRFTSSGDLCRPCSKCYGKYDCYVSRCVGRASIAVCPKDANSFRTYTPTSPPPIGTSVVKFVASGVVKMICPKCSLVCSTVTLGGNNLEYCKPCDLLVEYSAAAVRLDVDDEVRKEVFDGVVDVACGENFLAFLTSSNDLMVHGFIINCHFRSPVENPDRIAIEAIYCGSNHIAAISSRGDLYTCGLGAEGQLGYSSKDIHLSLIRVDLDGVVVKVCCGRSATICLMLDGSIYCFGSNMKLNGRGSLFVNQSDTDVVAKPTKIMNGLKSLDIAHVPFTNNFFARTASMVCSWGDKSAQFPLPQVIPKASDLMEVLVNRPIAVSCEKSPLKTHVVPHPLPTDFAPLYGQKYLSDLVFVFSDGTFPVHSIVLYTRSAYFRNNVLQETTLPKELDMTTYNPVAYKALLKYFYQLAPDALDCSDLVDLYLLATSYKETEIVVDAYNKLREKMRFDTVKLIHSKAKAAACKDLLEQCDIFMRSPEFQGKLHHILAQSTEATLSLL